MAGSARDLGSGALTGPLQAALAAERWAVLEGDSLELLPEIPDASVDAVVTDPPYGIGFNHQSWDGKAIREAAASAGHDRLSASAAYQAWCQAWAAECRRVLKPGAHLLAFGSPRTTHRLTCAIEDAGLEVRDTLMWLYGTGLPKSRRLPGGRATTLKPAYEPITLARRPPGGTIQQNLARHGTGALNTEAASVDGRHPANVALTHSPDCSTDSCAPSCPAAVIDEVADRNRVPSGPRQPPSRLFYCPKASRRERDAGCHELPRRTLDLFPNSSRPRRPRQASNPHPTVKPLALMRWLIRLTVPSGGLVLDPFCGSGTTGAAARLEGRRFLGLELDPAYSEIARARITHHAAARDGEPDCDPTERQAGRRPFDRSPR